MKVMVTGVGGGGHGEQILKALRLSQNNYYIVGADITKKSLGLASVDEKCILPPATAPEYIDTLLEECRTRDVQCLFHGSEPELKAMVTNRDAIASAGIFLPIQPTEVISLCMDKVKTFDLLRDKGFTTPQFQKVSSVQDAEKFSTFPAVMKPSVGSGGSSNTFIAQDRDSMIFFATYLLKTCDEFILQEYVGDPESEFTVGVLSDLDGNFINSIAVNRTLRSTISCRLREKNRTNRAELGDELVISTGCSQGEIGPFPEVTKQCEDIAKAIGSKGPLNIQCRLVGDTVYVFEINPRFSGTTSLRAMVGFNEPDTLIRHHILGEKIETRFDYDSATILRGYNEQLIDASW